MKIDLVKSTVVSINQATDKIKTFRLHYGDQIFKFKPGQWIDLYAPIEGKNIGGYTITSSCHEQGFIDLAVRESETHPVTQFLHQKLRVGDTLMISEGQGKFFLSEELMKQPLTFIAGGIGITPILSMVRSVDKTLNPFKVFYSISMEKDILFKTELSPFTIFTATKESSQNWKAEKERINISLLQKYDADFNSHFFICGPRVMIDKIVQELIDYGVTDEKIHFEKWW